MLLVALQEIVALIKPQFEVGKGKVGKGGVVRSPEEHARVIGEIQDSAAAIGYEVAASRNRRCSGPRAIKNS